MAFKMAKGSLFAILLRSNWWYSVLIGLFFLLASLLITEAEYVLLSVTGSMPFFGIGGFSAYKQLKLPSKKRILEVTEEVQKMSAGVIAEKIAANYIRNGYETAIFKGNSADLELTRGHRVLLLCTKRLKAATTGIQPLKSLVAAGEKTEASGYLYVTLGEISDSAHSYAQENNIEFIQIDRLTALFDGKAKID